jgi:hypothetical protein
LSQVRSCASENYFPSSRRITIGPTAIEVLT